MITLHILKHLEDNGFGTLVVTGNETGNDLLFHEQLPLGKNGVYILSNGDNLDRNARSTQSFDLYARGTNNLDGAQRLEEILEFFANECYPVCELPVVEGYSDKEYYNCTITPTSNIRNIGLDETDRMIYVVTAQIGYKLKEIE